MRKFLITGPLNQVLELAFVLFVYLGVKDQGYFIFQFPINDDWGVRDGVLTREGVWSCRFNHGDVENWMSRMHALWQMKGERVSTSLGDDGKRTKELL